MKGNNPMDRIMRIIYSFWLHIFFEAAFLEKIIYVCENEDCKSSKCLNLMDIILQVIINV